MKRIMPILLLITVGLLGSCSKENGTDDPTPTQPGTQTAYRPKLITDWAGDQFQVDYDGQGRIAKVLTVKTGSYLTYRYETRIITRSYYSYLTKTSSDDIVYTLNDAGQVTDYSSAISATGGKSRRTNISYDADGHVVSYETEGTNASGVRTYQYRYELTWQNGNLIRMRQLDLLKNKALVNDRTYEYDTNKLNTFFAEAIPNRTTFGTTDPNLNLSLLIGKGPKNVVTKDRSTADPTKFGAYTYTFDGDGRITSITYFGDKLTITY